MKLRLLGVVFNGFCFATSPLARPLAATDSTSLSGGASGRGWGGAIAEDCSIGVTAEHPNQLGFRVTVRRWTRGAIINWRFEREVTIAKHWGPVKLLPRHEDNHDGKAVLPFVLRGAGKPRSHAHDTRRTDSWGFVLQEPYTGHWTVACILPHAPPPPPSMNLTLLTAKAIGAAAPTMTVASSTPPDAAAPSVGRAFSNLAQSIASAFVQSIGLSNASNAEPNAAIASSLPRAKRQGKRSGRGRGRGAHRAKGKGKGRGRQGRRGRHPATAGGG